MAAIFGTRVGVVRGVRCKNAAGVLPDATALIPMEAQTEKSIRGSAMAGRWKLQPNPIAYNFGEFVLVRQL